MIPGAARSILLRTATGVFGGYALASAVAMALPVLLPMPRAEAVLLAAMLGLMIYPLTVLWVFAKADLRRIGKCLIAATLLLGAVGLLAPGSGA